MKKNVVKALLKAVVTTAMVSAVFISTGKEAKACYGELLSNGNCVCMDCFFAETGLDEYDSDVYFEWCCKKYGITSESEIAKMKEETVSLLLGAVYGESNMDITSHSNMLKLVNADRANFDSGELAWNTDLEAIARQRAYEVYCNANSAEYVNALNTNDYAAQAAIIHNGSKEGMKENAIVSFYSGVKEATANQNWIDSEGHHAVRINAAYTQYACASYTDPLTGVETWVEVFSDGTPLTDSSAFDYIRYAADYPDLAAAFGQDSTALYHHYITCGAVEGRTAYCTDGTVCRH